MYELQPIRIVDLVYFYKELKILFTFIINAMNDHLILNLFIVIRKTCSDPEGVLKFVISYYPSLIWIVGWYAFSYIEFGQG